MQRENQHYRLNVFIYIACVCVVETFSRENDTMHKYINKYAKHLLWMKREKKSGDGEVREKKNP